MDKRELFCRELIVLCEQLFRQWELLTSEDWNRAEELLKQARAQWESERSRGVRE